MKLLTILLLLPVFAFGQDSESHWVDKYNAMEDELLISDFTEVIGSAGWLKASGGASDTLHYDSVNTQTGVRSVAFYSTNSYLLARKVLSLNLGSYDMIALRFYFPAEYKQPADLLTRRIKVSFGTDLSNLYELEVDLAQINSFDNWYTLYLPKEVFTQIGSPDWSNLVRLYISYYGQVSGVTYVTFDKIWAGNSVTTGGILFNMDITLKSNYNIARDIFTRYGFTATLFNALQTTEGAIDTNMYVSKSNLVYLQNGLYWDVGSRGYVKTDYATDLTNTGLDTQYTRIKTIQDSLALRFQINAYPYGAHDRRVDSVSSHYFDYCRATTTNIVQAGAGDTNNLIFTLPIGSTNYSLNTFTFNNNNIDDLKEIVDSAIANDWVTNILFHQFGSTTDADRIDTTVLKEFLQYCKDKVDSSYLGYAGKISEYLLYAPNYMIRNKSRVFSAGVMQVIDSISLLADSMRIVLYDSTVTGWDSIAGTDMLVRGSICTLEVSGLPVGTHTLREWGVANSGHIDSMLAVYTLTNPAPVITSVEPRILYFKGEFVAPTDKVAEWNGDTVAMSSETDSGFYLPVAPKGDNQPDTLKVYAGSTSVTKVIKYLQSRTKLILGVK